MATVRCEEIANEKYAAFTTNEVRGHVNVLFISINICMYTQMKLPSFQKVKPIFYFV